VPVNAGMVPGERSKSAELTEPGRAAEELLCFRVKVNLLKNSKKNLENLTLDNTK
jgi:hypothetical protein